MGKLRPPGTQLSAKAESAPMSCPPQRARELSAMELLGKQTPSGQVLLQPRSAVPSWRRAGVPMEGGGRAPPALCKAKGVRPPRRHLSRPPRPAWHPASLFLWVRCLPDSVCKSRPALPPCPPQPWAPGGHVER